MISGTGTFPTSTTLIAGGGETLIAGGGETLIAGRGDKLVLEQVFQEIKIKGIAIPAVRVDSLEIKVDLVEIKEDLVEIK